MRSKRHTINTVQIKQVKYLADHTLNEVLRAMDECSGLSANAYDALNEARQAVDKAVRKLDEAYSWDLI